MPAILCSRLKTGQVGSTPLANKRIKRHTVLSRSTRNYVSEAGKGLGRQATRLEASRPDRRLQQVVQVKTQHAIPSFNRPWEGKNDGFSTASAFVVGIDGGKRKLLCTTAGAVEHARKVKVRKIGQAVEQEVKVAAVCLDADVALLSCSAAGFWDDLEAVSLEVELPALQDRVTVAGFPIGGESFCLTSGVVSRVEVVEYSHSGRSLLALQVDAAMNNGVWGGPLFSAQGRVVGMALQKSSTQLWVERYDEGDYLDAVGEDGEGVDDDNDDDDGDDSEEEEGEEGNSEEDEEDGDSENVGYAVPALLLQNIICEYEAAAASGPHGHTAEGSRSPSSSSLAGQHAGHDHGQEGQGGGPGSQPGRSSPPGIVRGQGQPGGTENGHDLVPEEGCNRSSAAGEAVGWKGEVAVAGPPYLGVRWRHLESLVLRRSLGLRKGNTGVLITGVDPSGSAAGGESAPHLAPAPGLAAGQQGDWACVTRPQPQGTAAAGPVRPQPAAVGTDSEQDPHQAEGGGLQGDGVHPSLAAIPTRRRPHLHPGVAPHASGGGLQEGDVLLALCTADGGVLRVGCDGMVTLGPAQKVLFGHCTSVQRVGEAVVARVLRGGRALDVQLTLRNPPPFIPSALGRSAPGFLILGGLVLLQLTLPLLHTVDLSPSVKRQIGLGPPSWCGGFDLGVLAALDSSMPSVDGEQVVVGCEVLAGSRVDEDYGEELLSSPYCTGKGGESLPRRLMRMNGLPVHNLQAVARWVVHATNSCGLPATQGLRVDQAPLGAVVGVRQASTAQGAGTQGRSVADSVLERPRAVASSAPGARGQGQSGQSMFLRLEFSDGYLLVLDMVTLKQDTREALAQHGISDSMPRSWQLDKSSWPFEGGGGGRGRQKRQQRRRLALRR